MKTGTAGIDQTTRKLADAMRLFFDLHKAAYGEDHIKPKHHWMLDIPPQLLRDGLVLDAFVIERQHLLVKNVANHIVNTRVFEASLGASVLTRQLQIAKEYRPGDKLVGKTSRLKDMAGVHIAEALEIYSIEFRANDVASKGPEVDIIVACASDESSSFFFVRGSLPACGGSHPARRPLPPHSGPRPLAGHGCSALPCMAGRARRCHLGASGVKQSDNVVG